MCFLSQTQQQKLREAEARATLIARNKEQAKEQLLRIQLLIAKQPLKKLG